MFYYNILNHIILYRLRLRGGHPRDSRCKSPEMPEDEDDQRSISSPFWTNPHLLNCVNFNKHQTSPELQKYFPTYSSRFIEKSKRTMPKNFSCFDFGDGPSDLAGWSIEPTLSSSEACCQNGKHLFLQRVGDVKKVSSSLRRLRLKQRAKQRILGGNFQKSRKIGCSLEDRQIWTPPPSFQKALASRGKYCLFYFVIKRIATKMISTSIGLELFAQRVNQEYWERELKAALCASSNLQPQILCSLQVNCVQLLCKYCANNNNNNNIVRELQLATPQILCSLQVNCVQPKYWWAGTSTLRNTMEPLSSAEIHFAGAPWRRPQKNP